MSNKNFDEMAYGKELSEKNNAFQEELKTIEQKHIDFFKGRKSHLDSREHDTLFSHCVTNMGSNGGVSFKFIDKEIPDYIMQECHAAFKKIFPDSTFQSPSEQ